MLVVVLCTWQLCVMGVYSSLALAAVSVLTATGPGLSTAPRSSVTVWKREWETARGGGKKKKKGGGGGDLILREKYKQ